MRRFSGIAALPLFISSALALADGDTSRTGGIITETTKAPLEKRLLPTTDRKGIIITESIKKHLEVRHSLVVHGWWDYFRVWNECRRRDQ